MWYEILPCLGIITAACTLPSVFNYYFQKVLQNDNPFKRDIVASSNKNAYLRDKWLTGNPYIMKGLENIPE